MSHKKIHPLYSVNERGRKLSKTRFLNQALNMFISALELAILTWGLMDICTYLEPVSTGQSTAGFCTYYLTSVQKSNVWGMTHTHLSEDFKISPSEISKCQSTLPCHNRIHTHHHWWSLKMHMIVLLLVGIVICGQGRRFDFDIGRDAYWTSLAVHLPSHLCPIRLMPSPPS